MVKILIPVLDTSTEIETVKKSIEENILAKADDVKVEYLYNDTEDESFSSKINRGMIGNDDDIVILHADMTVLPLWWTDLLFYVQDTSVGVLGSKMVFTSNPNIIQHFGGGITSEADAIHPHRGLIDGGDYNYCATVPFVTFGGVYIKRKVIDKVGYLDEAIYPWGFEDVDYCLRVRKEGWKVICTPATLWHDETRDAKTLPEFKEIIERNMEYVRMKHKLNKLSGVPAWV